MKTKLALACFVAAALMLPVAGYSADSPKTLVKDGVITAKIKAEMAKDKQVAARHIEVDTDHKGMVTLSGYASSRDEADKAVSIARGTKGVVAVEDNIKIR